MKDLAFKRSGYDYVLEFGDDLPPLTPDPTRQIDSTELLLALDRVFKQQRAPDHPPSVIVVRGADIVGNLALLEVDKEKEVKGGLTFSACRFRSACLMQGLAAGDRLSTELDIQDWLGGSRSVIANEEIIGLGRYGKTLTVLSSENSQAAVRCPSRSREHLLKEFLGRIS